MFFNVLCSDSLKFIYWTFEGYYYLFRIDKGTLTLQENKNGRRGLMTELSVQCSSCPEESPLETSFSITKRGQSLDINRRAAYHSLETGGGYEGLASFCSIMNMPCLSKPAYYQHVDTILNALELESSWTKNDCRIQTIRPAGKQGSIVKQTN